MSTSLSNQLIQSQHMLLTSKMIEELKVLQMSNIELSQYIDESLIENPLLEIDDSEDITEAINDNLDNNIIDEYNKVEQISLRKDFTEYSAASISLREHLLSQLGEIKIDTNHIKIAKYIINVIDDNGFLCESIHSIASLLKIPVQLVKEALKIVQSFEPAGVGARNLKECIILQLNVKKMLNRTNFIIVKDYLEMLGNRKYKEIAKKMEISINQVKAVHEAISHLTPVPGFKFTNSRICYIVPELVVREINNKYIVMFYDDKTPVLRINEVYKKLMKNVDCNKDEYQYVKSKISKGIETINAIEQRKRTVLRTADFIIQYQEEYFRNGNLYLKPLTMKIAANEVGVHESTISRTVNNKYIQTPKGIFELKYFFSNKIETDISSISANSVKTIIKRIILAEDKSKPFSDEQIRKIIEDDGIKIARRTVEKYRSELSILPANIRKTIDSCKE